MDEWLHRFADALDVPRLESTDEDALLDLARVVAHGTERKNAPLAAYLAGWWAARGRDPAGALRVANDLLPGEGS